jgi:hypothetical protein
LSCWGAPSNQSCPADRHDSGQHSSHPHNRPIKPILCIPACGVVDVLPVDEGAGELSKDAPLLAGSVGQETRQDHNRAAFSAPPAGTPEQSAQLGNLISTSNYSRSYYTAGGYHRLAQFSMQPVHQHMHAGTTRSCYIAVELTQQPTLCMLEHALQLCSRHKFGMWDPCRQGSQPLGTCSVTWKMMLAGQSKGGGLCAAAAWGLKGVSSC